MTFPFINTDPLFAQRFLKAAGYYQGKLDSIIGIQTKQALAIFLETTNMLADELGTFDNRSEQNIKTLLPYAQIEARKVLQTAKNFLYKTSIISGTRSYNEQNNLYRQGRFGNKGKIVTNAKAGYSYHNFGLAWDVGLFRNATYHTNEKDYQHLAASILATQPKLEWGGNWKSIKDYPHYQIKAGNIKTIREKFEHGILQI